MKLILAAIAVLASTFTFAFVIVMVMGTPAQAQETVRDAAHQVREDTHTAAVEVKHAVSHPRVRCRDGLSTFRRRGACRGHGGISPSHQG